MSKAIQVLSALLFTISLALLALSALSLLWTAPALPIGAKLVATATFGMFFGMVGMYVTDQVQWIKDMLDD